MQRADGSAKWSQDKTIVLAAVYGPRSTLGRKEDPEQTVVEVIFKPKSGLYRYNAPGQPCNYAITAVRSTFSWNHTAVILHQIAMTSSARPLISMPHEHART